MVEIIISDRADIIDATSAKIIKSANGLTLEAYGYIGGVQITLKHGADFSINLTENTLISDYATRGTQTILVLVQPSKDLLFTSTGDFEIEDLIVANSHDEIQVTIINSNSQDVINTTIEDEFSLANAYPNPFNPSTTIKLSVPEAGHVSVIVYNLSGQIVTKLADNYMNADNYQFIWNAKNIPSGMYFLRVEYTGQVLTQKLVLLQ